jgi:hypothetical protein
VAPVTNAFFFDGISAPLRHLDVMPRCSQPATLMRLPFVDSARELDIALYGVPFDDTKNQ